QRQRSRTAALGGVVERGQARTGAGARGEQVLLRGGQVAQSRRQRVDAARAVRGAAARRLHRVGQRVEGGEDVALAGAFDAEAVAGGGCAAELHLHAAGADGLAGLPGAGADLAATGVKHAVVRAVDELDGDAGAIPAAVVG